MSHVVSIKALLDDVEAIAATCKELGLVFKRNQKTYAWWGRSVGDYPLPEGFTAEDLGHCDHAIGIPGTSWEVGVVRRKDGKGYTLLFDFFGSQGEPILKALGGQQANRFIQSYALNKATLTAQKKGLLVTRKQAADGAVRLHITGSRL